MDQQGQSSYPDSLTPREHEVLALLREGLTNPQIAERLGFTLDGAKYHVSEILSKLGVASRDEAARWEPSERPWWATGAAPMAWLWRRASVSWIGTGAAGILAVMFLAGIGLLVWGLVRTNGDAADATATPPTTLVFLQDNDLWVAPLDGSAPPRAITSGSFRAGYAGYVPRTDGGIDLYYISQLQENQEFIEEVEFGVYRVGLEGGEPEELFRFSTDNAYLAGADVTPDGLRIVYADVDTLILRDLVSGEETVLARSRRILAGDALFRTGQFTSPIWSPTEERVYSSMFTGQDTIHSTIIDLPPRTITVTDIDYPGHRGSWSPDGSQLCLSSGDIYDGGLTLYDVETHEAIDVLASDVLPARIEGQRSSVGGCAWSEDGRLAVSYTPVEVEPHRVFVFDEQLDLVAQSELFAPFSRVIDWLPDGSGVVVARRSPDGLSFSAGIFRPGAAIEYLPFEADRIIAVIP